MKRTFITFLLASAAAGCSYGMTAARFRPATDPHGVMGTVTAAGVAFYGELIALQESGLIIMTSRAGGGEERVLRLLPYSSISSSRFEQLASRFSIREGSAPPGEVREHLQLVSRFPQGISAPVLAELLKANRQTGLAGVQR